VPGDSLAEVCCQQFHQHHVLDFGDKLGARPEQQLALNFLQAVHDLWIVRDQIIKVEERADDLVPALAQMCIKALAADLRDTTSAVFQMEATVTGGVARGNTVLKGEGAEPLHIRDVVNKIVHGTPDRVEVQGGIIRLYFKNTIPTDNWTAAWFSGTGLLDALSEELIKHSGEAAVQRERYISALLQQLGPDRLGPPERNDVDASIA
jgi:hypothetical protein